MKRDDKKGQFYLLAAMILVVVIAGLISVVNYSSSKNPSKVAKYGNELKIESERVLDYDLNNNANQIENFTKTYSDYMGSDVRAYFILGTNSSLQAYTYLNDVKTDLSGNLTTAGGRIIFIAEDSTYKFDLNRGQNFYFILSQNIEEGKFVYTN